MFFCGSFSFLKNNLLEIIKKIPPKEDISIITHTNKMRLYLKEFLAENLEIVANARFYTLIDIAKKLTGIEPIGDLEKQLILKRALDNCGYHNLHGLVKDIADTLQHIKEFQIKDIKPQWLKPVIESYDVIKDDYLDREDIYRIFLEMDIKFRTDNLFIFGFKTVAPLHQNVFTKLIGLSQKSYIFSPLILESGYYENYIHFKQVREFFEDQSKTKKVEDKEDFDNNINTGRNILRFSYSDPINNQNLEIYRCKNEEEQTRAVASKIAQLIQNGESYHRIGIIIPDIERYRSLIREIFPKYRIPYYLPQENRFIDKILYKKAFSLFELKLKNFSNESLMNTFYSDLLDIDNVSQTIELLKNHHNYFDDLQDNVLSKIEDEKIKSLIIELSNMEDISDIDGYIQKFRRISGDFIRDGKVRQFLEDIFDTLDRTDFYRRVFGYLTYQEFVDIVRTFFEREDRESKVEHQTVYILTPNSAQGNNMKHIFFVDLNSEVMPSPLKDDISNQTGRNFHIVMHQIATFSSIFDRGKKVYLYYSDTINSKFSNPSLLIMEIERITGKKPEKPHILPPNLREFELENGFDRKNRAFPEKEMDFMYKWVDIEFPVSVTSFSSYVVCPYRYFFEHMVGLKDSKQGDREKIPNHKIGIFIHRILREFYRNLEESNLEEYLNSKKEWIKDSFQEFFDQQKDELLPSSRIFEHIKLEKLRGNLIFFLEKDLERIKKRGIKIKKELLEKELSGESFRGRIDRVEMDPYGKYHIWDYKISSKNDIKDEVQITIYRNIILKTGLLENIESLKLAYIDIDINKSRIKTVDKIGRINADIKTYLENLKNGIFQPKDNGRCYQCEIKSFCPEKRT